MVQRSSGQTRWERLSWKATEKTSPSQNNTESKKQNPNKKNFVPLDLNPNIGYAFTCAYAKYGKMRKKEHTMPEETKTPEYDPKDHPWIEMPADSDSLDDALRFSLDEIRIA